MRAFRPAAAPLPVLAPPALAALVIAALVLSALLLASCTSAPEERRADIILITIDTMRSDRLGCYGYYRDTSPNLDSFAAEAIVFEDALAHAGTTLPSHVSLMTSTHLVRHGVYGNKRPFDADASGVSTIAQILRDLGYTTAGFVSATPVKKSSGIAVGFEAWGEPSTVECRAAVTVDRALAWLDGSASTSASDPAPAAAPAHSKPGERPPFFLWLHFFDAHDPYEPPPPFDTRFLPDQELLVYLEANEFTYWDHPGIQKLNCAYDGEVAYLDAELGRFFDGLRDRGLYEDAAVVVTADHGEGLGQHDWTIHDKLHDEILRVPLIVKLPETSGEAPGRREGLVGTVDVVPTLVEELALPVPAEIFHQFEGRNLLRDEPRAYVFSERIRDRPDKLGPGEKSALTGDSWKYLLWSAGEDELFHLSSNPFELRNVRATEPDTAAGLRETIEARLAGTVTPASEREVTSERLEELRALGYVD